MIDYEYPSEPVGTDAFEQALDRYTHSRTSSDNTAVLMQNGDEAYPAMLELIRTAKHRISFETYIIEDDETTNTFFAALEDAAARGVEVRTLVDAAGFKRGTIAQLNELSNRGIQARIFNPLLFSWTIFRFNNRDHRKILVVDGAHAVLGGINVSDEQTGDGTTGWRDTSILVSGPAALNAESVFAETWEQGGRGFVGKNLPIASLNPIKHVLEAPLMDFKQHFLNQPLFVPTPCGDPAPIPEAVAKSDRLHPDVTARIVASAPDKASSSTYDLSLLGIHGARERIDVACAYFVPHRALKLALVEAAARGVRIRLLLPGVTDIAGVREIGMKSYGGLLEAGVEIYEWPHEILHAKTMAVDGKWLVVGSANMDGRSYFLNYEANVVVSDSRLADDAHNQFEIDLDHAARLTLEEWKNRPAKQQALEVLLTPAAGQF
jgi:Phosphatidylserine/phosphatidylglycerophosphate/cardiolipin synthases and related enzymes